MCHIRRAQVLQDLLETHQKRPVKQLTSCVARNKRTKIIALPDCAKRTPALIISSSNSPRRLLDGKVAISS